MIMMTIGILSVVFIGVVAFLTTTPEGERPPRSASWD